VRQWGIAIRAVGLLCVLLVLFIDFVYPCHNPIVEALLMERVVATRDQDLVLILEILHTN